MGLFGRLFSPRERKKFDMQKRMSEAVVLAMDADQSIANSSFGRAYMGAFASCVPMHVAAIVFPELPDRFPPYRDIWKAPDSRLNDLASVLAWRNALDAFQDFAPEDKDARERLMVLCHHAFPASDRAMTLMRRYAHLEKDAKAREKLMQSFPIGEHPGVVHFSVINEALEGPDFPSLEDCDPAIWFFEVSYLFGIRRDISNAFRQFARAELSA